MLDIHRIPVLKDNYVWLAHEPSADVTAVVDPAVAEPVEAALRDRGWRLTHILNTHHHGDHTGANLALKAAHGCTIVGPAADRARIPGIDVAVADGDRCRLGAAEAEVFDVPGHTRGHIAFWFAADRALFCGDTLFALGCGRLFEGTPDQMWRSLGKLRALPGDTRVFCAHEYTQSNARFALTVDGGNPALVRRAAEVDALRARGEPTVPSTIALERATNPFLRADERALALAVGLPPDDPVAVFAEVRRRKDSF
ncbi:hydroxyacylglutathione hydrolase [Stella sp.]|uniref:hydroxyacylglutathione hydrolase n=1 Tax=Stella sp. TaxID=2912054 RepID=UPI0035B2F215